MLTGIRHTTVLVLGFILLALALAACSGTPDSTPVPIPDIEATVQARLNEERAVEAIVEARVELAKAAPTIPAPAPTRKPDL